MLVLSSKLEDYKIQAKHNHDLLEEHFLRLRWEIDNPKKFAIGQNIKAGKIVSVERSGDKTIKPRVKSYWFDYLRSPIPPIYIRHWKYGVFNGLEIVLMGENEITKQESEPKIKKDE